MELEQSKTKQRSTFIERLILLSALDIAFSRKKIALDFKSFSVLSVNVALEESEDRIFDSSA